MDLNKFTQKSQEALSEAQSSAVRFGHQQVEAEHLLLALASQENGLVPRLLDRAGIEPQAYAKGVEAELSRLPSVSGPGHSPARSTSRSG
jgi:ATP-dependent Clp protease ATP-binding subunit ClpB